MVHSQWSIEYPKNKKPTFDELLRFLPDPIGLLFVQFNEEMNRAYRVYNKWHRYEKHVGWVYGYCRNYRCELLCVTLGDDLFHVLDVDVMNEESLRQALQKAKEAYDGGYEERYALLSAEKRADQSKRAVIRLAREKELMKKIQANLDLDRFNRFQWAPRVS